MTAEASALQTDSPVTGVVLQNREVNDLPLNFGSGGRDAENFAIQLAPGVAGSASGTEINGTPQFSKEVLLDGATATGYRSGDFYQQSPSPEALQEFKVETSGMSAEYGRTSGGLFNFVMKSGTNQVHGSALFEFRNQDLDANTFLGNFNGHASRDRPPVGWRRFVRRPGLDPESLQRQRQDVLLFRAGAFLYGGQRVRHAE